MEKKMKKKMVTEIVMVIATRKRTETATKMEKMKQLGFGSLSARTMKKVTQRSFRPATSSETGSVKGMVTEKGKATVKVKAKAKAQEQELPSAQFFF